MQFARILPGGSEFLTNWTAARAWLREGLHPYLPEVMTRVQEQLYGRAADPQQGELQGIFLYPFPSILLHLPFSLVSYPVARAIWMTLIEVTLPLTVVFALAAVRMSPNRVTLASLLIFSVVWLPGLNELITGGTLPVILLLLSGGMLALRRGQDSLAGILLGLSLFIPWVSLPAVLFILLWSSSARRWQPSLWAMAILGSFTALSLLLQPDWVRWWLIQLVMVFKNGGFTSGISLLQTASNPLTRFIPWIVALAIVAYLVFEWSMAFRKAFWWGMWTTATTMAMSVLILPDLGQETQILLLPAISLIVAAASERWGRVGRRLASALLILLVGASWLIAFRIPPSHVGRLIATWTAPSVLLVCLWWMRWWITHRSLETIEIRG